jgi:hypothetical protein
MCVDLEDLATKEEEEEEEGPLNIGSSELKKFGCEAEDEDGAGRANAWGEEA